MSAINNIIGKITIHELFIDNFFIDSSIKLKIVSGKKLIFLKPKCRFLMKYVLLYTENTIDKKCVVTLTCS